LHHHQQQLIWQYIDIQRKFGMSCPITLLRKATSTNNHNLNEHKRLAHLGNTVLKLITNLHVFRSYSHASTFELDTLRSDLISTDKLLQYAFELQLPSMIRDHNQDEFDLESVDIGSVFADEKKRIVSTLYALIATSYIHGGMAEANRFCNNFGLDIGNEPSTLIPPDNHVKHLWQIHGDYIGSIEKRLGYTFHRRQLLVEALTSPTVTTTSNYTRLAFIGDAVLDLIVTEHLYNTFNSITPSMMSTIREKSVNNSTFADLCVKSNLHFYIIHNQTKVAKDIKKYSDRIHLNQKASKSPKILGEVFESVAGAICLDSGNDVNTVKRVIEHIAPIQQQLQQQHKQTEMKLEKQKTRKQHIGSASELVEHLASVTNTTLVIDKKTNTVYLKVPSGKHT
jgi:dsRNA-specific ribonuclease